MRVIKKIIAILLILLALYNVLTINHVNASQASISVSSDVVKGSNYTVTVNIPSDAIGYQGIIKVTYSDKSTDSSGMLIKWDPDLENHPGNMTASFTAKAAGKATVTVEDCTISDKKSNHIDPPNSITFNIAEKETTVKNNVVNNTTTNTNTNTSANTSTNTSSTNTNTSPTTTVTFKDVNETVYATVDDLNIRKSYSTSSSVIAKISEGTKLTRTGISDKWSRVAYKGQTAYVSSQYLSTTAPKEKEVTFKDVNEKMYAVRNCNVREGYSTDTEQVGSLKLGEEITRTGVGSNGWSKVTYKGKTAYVLTSLLSSKKPSDEENTVSSVANNTVNNSVTNVVEDSNKVSKEEVLNIIKDEVGVLPEVGINPAVITFTVITAIAIITSLIIIYKKKTEK